MGLSEFDRMVVAEDRLLRISEVQEILRLSRWTVLEWIERGYLNAIVLPSGQKRIRMSELERILMEGTDGV